MNRSRFYLSFFLILVLMLVSATAEADRSTLHPVLKSKIQILETGDKMSAYRAAADLAKTNYSHPFAAKIILEIAVKPKTPEGTRLFLFRAYARQMKMLRLREEGLKALVPFLGKFGTLTDPVMEAIVMLGPKSLPYLAKGLACSNAASPKSDKEILITRQDLSASAITAVASDYPNAPEIDEIADTLLSCIECGSENAALLCARTFARVNTITPEHKKRLAAVIEDSRYSIVKAYAAQLLGMLHETDPAVEKVLEEALNSPDEAIRFAAAYALARYFTGHRKALETLKSISKSENKQLREYALGAIEKFGNK